MSRFSIKVTSLQLSQVTDNETGKVYNCKNSFYVRTRNEKTYRQFYVNVSNVETRKMKDNFSFPWKAELQGDGKFHGTNPVGLICETDLAGKTSSVNENDFCFE